MKIQINKVISLTLIYFGTILTGCASVAHIPSAPSVDYFERGRKYLSVDYFERGRKYLNEKNYNLAIQNFTEYINRNSGNNRILAPAYSNRCMAFYLKGEYDIAIRDCSEAIRLNPKLRHSYRYRGFSFLGKQQYELAIRDFTECIYLDPNKADAYAGRGAAYSAKDSYNSSIKDLTEAIRLGPKSWWSYSVISFTYLDMGNLDKAEENMRKAADLKNKIRDKAGMLENIGLIYLKQGKWESALVHSKTINEMSNDLAWNWLFRSIAAYKMGDINLAKSAYEKWIKLQKPSDKKGLEKYLPEQLHFYLNNLPTSIASPSKIDSFQKQLKDTTPPKIYISKKGDEQKPKNVIDIQGNYHALLIGINNYQKLEKLETPVFDVQILSELLQHKYGFYTQTLVNEKATRDNIIDTINEIRKKLQKEDKLIIYYAGHGHFDKNTGTGYWLPVDAERDSDTKWIMADTITTNIKRISADHVMVIADSCYSGTLSRGIRVNIGSGALRTRYINKILKKRSRILIASGGNEPVIDSGGAGHSVFAQALIDGLNEIERKVFTAEELLVGHIKEAVAGSTEQTPEFKIIRNSGHKGGDFVFRKQ